MPPPNAPLHRILVVDDEPDITALVAYHLAKAGYRVITATNGKDALQTAREERPDLVVLDLMLPDVSGYDVLAELRRRDETREIGILLLTARHKEVGRVRGLTLGADDYLLKPFSPPEAVLTPGARPAGRGDPASPARTRRRGGRPAERRADPPGPHGAPRHGEWHGGRADRDRVQAAAHPDRARRPSAKPCPAAGGGVARPAGRAHPHGRHAPPATASQARVGRPLDRDDPGRGVLFSPGGTAGAQVDLAAPLLRDREPGHVERWLGKSQIETLQGVHQDP